jgi:hypothetical protein
MSHDPVHDPQRQQAQEPYSFHSPYSPYDPPQPYAPQQAQPLYPYPPYDPQESQPTFVSPQPYAPQQVQQLYPSQQPQASYASGTRSEQRRGEAGQGQKLSAQLWHGLVQLLGVRGVVVAFGAVLAVLAFFVLPYYSNYSGYFLAAQTLDDKWWLELILAVLPLVVLLAQPVVPRLKGQQRRLALVVAGCGVLGILVHYWFMNGVIGSSYWRLGTWSYFLGMTLVALGGLLLSVVQGERR